MDKPKIKVKKKRAAEQLISIQKRHEIGLLDVFAEKYPHDFLRIAKRLAKSLNCANMFSESHPTD